MDSTSIHNDPDAEMTKTLLYVHGTGVRGPAYEAACELIERQIERYAKGTKLARCLWGDSEGAQLSAGGKSIPDYDDTRGADALPEDNLPALWSLLLQDPAFELSLLADTPAPDFDLRPDEEDPSEHLLEQFRALAHNTGLNELLDSLGIMPIFSAFEPARTLVQLIDELIATPGYADCALSAMRGTPEHREALARSVVASLQKLALEARVPTLDVDTRDALVEAVKAELGNDVRGPVGWLMSPLTGLAAALLRRRRGALTDMAYPKIGDILLYQARGQLIRDFIRARIDQLAGQQVVVLAHSLGGIACVELLAQARPAHVERLVTFGSQAPFLYELGALSCVPADTGLPPDFPPWTNFYDLNDQLSYVGAKVFPNRVSDHELISGELFPAAHGAYLHNKAFWQQLSPFLRDA